MFRVGIIAVLAMLMIAAAPILSSSHPPSNSQRTEAQAKPSEKNGAYNQSNSERAPFFVKLVIPEQDKGEADKDTQERQWKTAPEQQLADYTWYLAAATVALVLVAMVQVGLFFWQLIYMKEGVKDARDNAAATLKMANLARDEFNASHRPRIILRWAELHTETGVPKIELMLANIGETSATIEAFDAGVGLIISVDRGMGTRWVDPPGFVMQPMCISDKVVANGERRSVEFCSDYLAGNKRIGHRLFVAGVIKYRDSNGTLRETSFIRWYDDQFNRFSHLEEKWIHSELEYAD